MTQNQTLNVTLHVIWIQSSALMFNVLGRFLALPVWCGDPDKKSQASKICCYRLPIIVQSTSKVYSSHNGTDSMEGFLLLLFAACLRSTAAIFFFDTPVSWLIHKYVFPTAQYKVWSKRVKVIIVFLHLQMRACGWPLFQCHVHTDQSPDQHMWCWLGLPQNTQPRWRELPYDDHVHI